jgi:hypothetical protein
VRDGQYAQPHPLVDHVIQTVGGMIGHRARDFAVGRVVAK